MNTIHDIESYDISGKGLPDDVEKKIRLIHRPSLERVQCELGDSIKLEISLKSAYRSKEWERSKGRSGYSEHTYSGLGALDLTFNDFATNKDKVLKALIEHSLYTRIAVYNSFIHCDFKNKINDSYVYNSAWVRQYKIER